MKTKDKKCKICYAISRNMSLLLLEFFYSEFMNLFVGNQENYVK